MVDNISAVYKCRPDVEWRDNSVNGFSLETIRAAYIGDDFPTQGELDAARLLCQDDIRIEELKEQLASTDIGFIRVLEDLMDVNFDVSKLPQVSKDKINERKNLRGQLNG